MFLFYFILFYSVFGCGRSQVLYYGDGKDCWGEARGLFDKGEEGKKPGWRKDKEKTEERISTKTQLSKKSDVKFTNQNI